MPRNVSRSPHELVTYTFALLYSAGHAQGAGRILADRIEFILSVFQRRVKSENNSSSAIQGRVFTPRPFLFWATTERLTARITDFCRIALPQGDSSGSG